MSIAGLNRYVASDEAARPESHFYVQVEDAEALSELVVKRAYFLMVCGAPQSGKTTLAYAMRRAIHARGGRAVYVNLSTCLKAANPRDMLFGSLLQQFTGVDRKEYKAQVRLVCLVSSRPPGNHVKPRGFGCFTVGSTA